MQLEVVGPQPFARDTQGRQLSRIGTIFPAHGVLWTEPPGVHAVQRLGAINRINTQRAAKGLTPLSSEEEDDVCLSAVDLIFEADHILIRPDPDRMDLAFEAD